MVSKEEKKLNRVIGFLTKGLTGLADELESTIKNINEFKDSLQKAQKDLKTVEPEEEAEAVTTVSTSSQKVVAANPGTAKSAAASTLFNLLSGTAGARSASSSPLAAPSLASPKPPASGGPPKAPAAGPPSAPSLGSPPKAPSAVPVAGPPSAPSSGGPPKKGANLPPAPKLPPAPGSGAPPQAPPGVKAPAFAKRPEQPMASVGGGGEGVEAAASSGVSGAPLAAKPGGGLGSLRDEMLDELNRLKKIMRGE